MNNEHSDIDDLMLRVDWGRLSEIDKAMFANSMLALEISHREREKSRAIVSSRYRTTITTLVFVLAMLFFEISPMAMLITVTSIQMLALLYHQVIEGILGRFFDRANLHLKNILKEFEKKHPIVDNKDIV